MNNRDFDNECVICYEENNIKQIITCKHKLCETCIKKIDKCPICNKLLYKIVKFKNETYIFNNLS